MDQELKQRLIGAAVITALAAIFVPMLFDDPIDESGKNVSELKIPEIPVKAQDVEIMPLPEKVEDVATTVPEPKPQAPAAVYEGDEEADMEAPKPVARITAKETAPAPVAKFVEPAEEEDVPVASPPPAPTPSPVGKPSRTLPTEIAPPAAVNKPAKPVVAEPPVSKPVAANNNPDGSVARLYLNAGSFSQLKNAQALQENLQKQGFASSIKEVSGEKGTVYKVRVGPMLDKAKAQAIKAKLAQININSFLTGDE